MNTELYYKPRERKIGVFFFLLLVKLKREKERGNMLGSETVSFFLLFVQETGNMCTKEKEESFHGLRN